MLTAAQAPGVRHLRATGWVGEEELLAGKCVRDFCKGLQLDSRGDTCLYHPSWTPHTPADQVAWGPGAGTLTGVSRKEPTGLQIPPQGQFAVGSSEKLSPSPALGLST